MKIFVSAYINKNLGDDIFISMLCDRYKKHTFLIDGNADYIKKDNLEFYYNKKNIFKKIINKIKKIFTQGKKDYDTKYIKKCDAYVMIGGSLFIENKKNSKLKNFIDINIPYYILGINFGPYYTNNYYNKSRKFFKNASDVCFRDKESFKKFSDLNNVRYSPDIIFGYNISKSNKNNNNKSVVISIIDCSNRFKNEIADNYEKQILKLIDIFLKSEYKITLMSFCKNEGDEVAINKIYNNIISDKNNIEKYFYDGNYKEAIKILDNSEIIVGSRFHANILGLKKNKKIVPIAYSDKTIDALKDLGYTQKIYDIRKINEFNFSNFNIHEINNTDKLNIKNAEINAENHFLNLDKFLSGDINE